LGGEVKDVLLLDVTPLTLGIETLGGVATPIIERNTTIPTRKSQIFSTAADGQTQVEVHVIQGERPMAADNKSLARFILDGIPPAPRGMPQIEVAFDIDANGIVNVHATDKATNREQHVTIQPSSGLSKEEVEKMVKDAERYAAEDTKRKEEVEIRNNADSAVYQAEKLMRDMGDKVSPETRADVESKINALKDVMKGREVEPIRRRIDELQQALMKIGEQAYAGAGGPPPGGGFGSEGGFGPSGSGGFGGDGGNGGPEGGQRGGRGGETVEGEYREV
jgi:molecular chaperone DnaK